MEDKFEFLKMRVLLCFLKSDKQACTVTGIARTLHREKYSVSRAMTALEKENYISRAAGRKPMLTEMGYEAAIRYEERLSVSLNHLLYEGVDIESAKQDAFLWSRYCTDQTMEAIRASENRYRVKYELRGRKQFSGSTVCKLMRDGSYNIPFVIYREQAKNGTHISIANDGFEHPCVLNIENGVGTVHLRAVSTTMRSAESGEMVTEKVQTLRYFDMGTFVVAENSGDIFSFPAEVLQFLNYGSGVGQILHGSICLQMQCPAEPTRDHQFIFTMLL